MKQSYILSVLLLFILRLLYRSNFSQILSTNSYVLLWNVHATNSASHYKDSFLTVVPLPLFFILIKRKKMQLITSLRVRRALISEYRTVLFNIQHCAKAHIKKCCKVKTTSKELNTKTLQRAVNNI